MSTVVCCPQRTLKQLEREQTDTHTHKVTLAHARRGLTTIIGTVTLSDGCSDVAAKVTVLTYKLGCSTMSQLCVARKPSLYFKTCGPGTRSNRRIRWSRGSDENIYQSSDIELVFDREACLCKSSISPLQVSALLVFLAWFYRRNIRPSLLPQISDSAVCCEMHKNHECSMIEDGRKFTEGR